MRDYLVYLVQDATTTMAMNGISAEDLQAATCASLGMVFARIVSGAELLDLASGGGSSPHRRFPSRRPNSGTEPKIERVARCPMSRPSPLSALQEPPQVGSPGRSCPIRTAVSPAGPSPVIRIGGRPGAGRAGCDGGQG